MEECQYLPGSGNLYLPMDSPLSDEADRLNDDPQKLREVRWAWGDDGVGCSRVGRWVNG